MSATELHRHQCEVRWCITKGREWFESYVKGVKAARGATAAKRLWADVREQAAAGNTGARGQWMEARKGST